MANDDDIPIDILLGRGASENLQMSDAALGNGANCGGMGENAPSFCQIVG